MSIHRVECSYILLMNAHASTVFGDTELQGEKIEGGAGCTVRIVVAR